MINPDEILLRARANIVADCVELIAKQGDAFATDVVFTKVEPGSFVSPTLRISHHAAQALMDDLWNAGLRPTEGTGSAGSLKATQNHLNDMRAIVFKQLRIKS